MRIKNENALSSGFVPGIVVLVLGFLIGAVLSPFHPPRGSAADLPEVQPLTPTEIALQVPAARAAVPEEPPVNDLKTIYVDLDDEASRHLQEVYDRAHELRYIAQEEGDLVPATIRGDDKTIQAKVRIKGDFLDHLDTDKWSLRIELKGDKLWGMSRFSIQHPKTRSYLWEWLFMEMARRDGLLAPRTAFVNVVMNGNSTGIYYLEEHFTKELLESQGRREGPILRFVEDTFLDMEAHYITAYGYGSETVLPARLVTSAKVAAYGEKHLNQSPSLARQLEQGLDLMRRIQEDQEGRQTHNLLDIDSHAVMAALSVLFRTSHGMNWKSLRYYHNPVTARVEPIVFDTGAGMPRETRDPIEILRWVIPAYLKNPFFYQAFFREIGRISEPEYIDRAFADLGPKLRHFEELMHAEGLEDPLLDAAAVEAEVRAQQVHMHELVHPRIPVSFDCRLLSDDPNADRPKGVLEVEAWANTRVPVVLYGFRLGNGIFREAHGLPVSGGEVSPLRGEPGAVVLPTDNTHVVFSFRNDEEREGVLRDVAQLKDAILSGDDVDRSLKLSVHAESRLITDQERTEETLQIRKFAAEWGEEGGRPSPPSVDDAIEKHGFLRLNESERRLEITPGEHDVQGDLVVPDGYALHATGGTRLRFGTENALVTSGPLLFEGDEDAPIVLEPKPEATSWQGVAVIQSDEKSVWRNVHVRDTDIIRRGGWMTTGGVNFYRSPVDVIGCRFDDAHGEDALNVFGVPCLLDGVVMDTVASDAFDGDFVTGTVMRSTFLSSVEDAVDVSGSDLTVEGCRFIAIGDKAISAGENSAVHVRDCVVESASIAVASKDFSRVDVDGLDVWSTINYGFAAYIKKPEFGPSTIVADNVTLGEMGRGPYLIQHTCKLDLNGVACATVPVDVKEMYRQKILGQ